MSLSSLKTKKGRCGHSALNRNRIRCYLAFLPPLSSFLPFFFMEAPSVALRITGAIAGFSSAKLEIYERAARLSSSIRAEIEKVLLRSRAGYLAGVIAVASLDGEALAFHPDLYVMNIR